MNALVTYVRRRGRSYLERRRALGMFVFALSVGLIQSMLQEGLATYPTASDRG